MVTSRLFAIALASLGFGACLDTSSKTDLFPDLQPMMLQTRLTNSSIDPMTGFVVDKKVFGFGSNPEATSIDTPDPTSIRAAAAKQTAMRLIVSDLLVGNYLEEIECRANVDDDNFDFVPIGATPDDIAACSVAPDILVATCTGSHAVCICHNQAGCIGADGTSIAFGAPVGVQDVNQDGATDDTRFRKGAVTLQCNGSKMHSVGLNLDASYWNPSGNQLVPAKGGFDALGHAVVVQTADVGPVGHTTSGVLPTGSTCSFVFAPEVVDKKGQRPCAPGGGGNDPSLIPTLACTPGDFSAASFKTEALAFTVSSELNSMLMSGGQIARTDVLVLSTGNNIPLDPGSLGGITILEGAAPFTQFTASFINADQTIIGITPTNATGFDPNASYTLNVPTTITDTFGEPNAQPITFNFTTGAM